MKDKDFGKLVDTLNHNVTLLQNDVKWLKLLGYYMAFIMTGILIRGFI